MRDSNDQTPRHGRTDPAPRAFLDLSAGSDLAYEGPSFGRRVLTVLAALGAALSLPLFWASSSVGDEGEQPAPLASSAKSGSGSEGDGEDDGDGEDTGDGDDPSATGTATSRNGNVTAGTTNDTGQTVKEATATSRNDNGTQGTTNGTAESVTGDAPSATGSATSRNGNGTAGTTNDTGRTVNPA